MMQRYLLDNVLLNKVHHIEALDLLALLPDQSIDAIITDLPYGTTACAWDEIIPFAPMWAGVRRVLKPRGVFVTTASQPFTSALVMSNPAWFRYEIIVDKVLPTGYLDANRRPLKVHENILVFSEGQSTFNPQMTIGATPYSKTRSKSAAIYNKHERTSGKSDGKRYPKSIIEYSFGDHTDILHNTQKPVSLYRYLVRTYTQPGEIVLDFCCGSGTTGEACREEQRRFILGEKDALIAQIAQKRMDAPYTLPLFAAVGGD